ncbi:hypothetical protein EDB59_0855 [Vibrio crassostreae]|nr:hypothetical protein EDB59_0855 [Vibrio crassostreae]
MIKGVRNLTNSLFDVLNDRLVNVASKMAALTLQARPLLNW